MLLGHFEPRLLVLQKIPYVLYFRQFKEGIQRAFCIEEDVQGLDLFPALGYKIGRIAFKDMGEVGAQPIDLI